MCHLPTCRLLKSQEVKFLSGLFSLSFSFSVVLCLCLVNKQYGIFGLNDQLKYVRCNLQQMICKENTLETTILWHILVKETPLFNHSKTISVKKENINCLRSRSLHQHTCLTSCRINSFTLAADWQFVTLCSPHYLPACAGLGGNDSYSSWIQIKGPGWLWLLMGRWNKTALD